MVQCHTKVGKLTTSLKVKIDFTLPELSVTEIAALIFHLDDSTKIKYHMILGGYLLRELELNLKFSDHVIKEYG